MPEVGEAVPAMGHSRSPPLVHKVIDEDRFLPAVFACSRSGLPGEGEARGRTMANLEKQMLGRPLAI